MKRLVASVVAAATLAAPVVVAPAADATGCASYREYKTLPVNYTKTPAWVQHHFGVKGTLIKRTSYFDWGTWAMTHKTLYRYPGCNRAHPVYVRFIGSANYGSAVAYWKKRA